MIIVPTKDGINLYINNNTDTWTEEYLFGDNEKGFLHNKAVSICQFSLCGNYLLTG